MLKKLLAAGAAILASGLIALAASNMSLDGTLNVGRVANLGSPPVVSVCGTSPAVATGSTDVAFRVTVGTSASNACTITFAAAYLSAPVCVIQNMTTGAGANVYTVSTSAIVFSSALADSTVLAGHCIGVQGG